MQRYGFSAIAFLTLALATCPGQQPAERLPEGAIVRLGSLAFRFGERHDFLGFSSDGKEYYVTPFFTGGLYVRDLATSRVLRRFQFPPAEARILAVSADGRFAATCGGFENVGLRIRSPAAGKILHQFSDYDWRFPPHLVTFTRKGDLVAVADEHGGMRIYDVPTGARLASPLPDGKYENQPTSDFEITSLQFSAVGRRLLVGRPKKTPLIWDLKEARVVCQSEDSPHKHSWASFVRGDSAWVTVPIEGWGIRLLIGGESFGVSASESQPVSVTSIGDGQKSKPFDLRQSATAASASGDGRLLATLGEVSGDGRHALLVWDLESGLPLAQTMDVPPHSELAFAPDNRTLATISNRAFRLWRLPGPNATNRELVELHPAQGMTEGVSSLHFTGDGRQLLIASNAGVAVWSLPERKLIQRVANYDAYTGNVLAMDPEGEHFILGFGKFSRRYCVNNHTWLPEAPGPLLDVFWYWRCIAISPDGRHVVAGMRKSEMFTIGGAFPATFSVFAAADAGMVTVDAETRKALSGRDVSCLAFDRAGKALAVGISDEVCVLDPANRFCQFNKITYSRGLVRALAFSADGHFLAVGGGKDDRFPEEKSNKPSDHGVVLYPSQGEWPLNVFEGHTRPVRCLAYSPDGKWLVTGSDDKTIRIWDARKCKEAKLLRGHEGGVSAVAFSPDGKILATGSEDTTVLLWDFEKLVGKS